MDARLNGKQLAERVGWLATKVSKLEHGKQTPTEDDIRAWVAATGAERELGSLLAQLLSLELAYSEWRRQLRDGLRARQMQIGAIETETGLFRMFEPAVVPGLLQTGEYARAMMRLSVAVHRIPNDLDAGVAARLARQQVLYEAGKRFHFIISEATLRYLFGPPEVSMGQIERLVATATLPNVALGVIPFTARLPKHLAHGFAIYDERLVLVESFGAELSLTQPQEIELYGRIFGIMHEVAVYGREAHALMMRVMEDLAGMISSNTEQSP